MSHNSVLDRNEALAAQVWTPKTVQPSVIAVVEESVLEPEVTLPDDDPSPVTEQTAEQPLEPAPEASASGVDPALLDQAREEAYALGLADGRRAAELAALAERDALAAMMSGLTAEFTQLQGVLAEQVLSLGLDLTRVLLRQKISLDSQAVLPVLREAMAALPGLGQQIVVHLHPQDAALVGPLLAQDATLSQSTWNLVEDLRIERGGCRLETSHSEVDATLATRWNRLVAALGREDAWQAEAKKQE